MNEQENIDLSKVIGLIMENPSLVEQISSLVKQSSTENKPEDIPPATEETSVLKEENEPKAEPTYSPIIGQRNNRAQLLGALKPYVSKERAKAIDSMISIADILDMMKAR